MQPAVRLVAFDLDNTLYDEGVYFAGAFKVIVPRLAAKSGWNPAWIEERLHATLGEKGRHYHYLFNDVLAAIGLDPQADLADVLDLFRTVEPPIEPFPGTRDLLADLRCRYRLGMITSGMQQVQENKIKLLDIAGYFEEIVYSSTLPENKPGRLPFQRLLGSLGVAAAAAVYVGDNPLFDFKGANEIGMLTVRVRNPEFDTTDVPPECDGR
ncbi:MAG: HAD family hydrolase, partial [Vicinamibacteria bacterium]